MKYKFSQFEAEILNPTVTIQEPYSVKVSENKVSLSVLLKTNEAQFGVQLNDLTVNNIYTDDLMAIVLTALSVYLVD